MDVGADSTNPFDQIKVLYPVAFLGSLLNAAMSIAKAYRCAGNNFSIYNELEEARLL